MKNRFRVSKEEAIPASIMTLVFAVMQMLVVRRFFDTVIHRLHGDGSDFIHAMPVSGFDAYACSMLADWTIAYDPYRHPLIALFYYPLYGLNQLFIGITGLNCSYFIMAVFLLAGVFYSYVFLYRICRELIGVCRFDANLLSVMLFSMAYIILSMLIPDHFGLSMPLLIIALYISGSAMKAGLQLSIRQTWLLFLPIAGLTLSNGIKVFLDAWFVNGRRFFSLRYLLLAILLPSAILWGIASIENSVRDAVNNAVKLKNDKIFRSQLLAQITDTASIKDSAYIHSLFKREVNKRIWARYRQSHQYDHIPRQKGKPISNKGFLSWTDLSTSRWETFVENFFGESLLLHEDYLLQDVFRGRPVIVHYQNAFHYIVEILLLLLFVAGVWCGKHSRFLWMCLAGMSVDIFLHLVLGFAIDEVYIMTAHWAFVIPIVIGFLLASVPLRIQAFLRILLMVATTFLWIYNGKLLLSYLV